jgi:hypothetical protein
MTAPAATLTANLGLALQLCAPCRRSSRRIERLEMADNVSSRTDLIADLDWRKFSQ